MVMMSQLDKIVEWLKSFLDSVGRARAASELARNGYHKEANRLINGKPLID
jgi:hypothetical protein